MDKIEELKKILVRGKKCVIIPHSRPDADAIGSSKALCQILNKIGLSTSIISPNDYPNFLSWIDDKKDILVYQSNPKTSNSSKENQKSIENKILEADLIFCVDFSSLSRINDLAKFVENSKATKINIDHHLQPENFADIVFWDVKASATAILIYKLIIDLKIPNLLDKQIGEYLYAGIITDTGNFQNPNTTSEALNITSKLINLGIDFVKINDCIYRNNTINKIKFLGFALSQRLVLMPKYDTAYIWIKKSDWDNYNLKVGDTEGLVNYALSIENINFAALISEQYDFIRLSFRSRKNLKINHLAKDYFDGGGHANAAGGKSSLSLESTIEKFENIVKTHLNKLK